MTTGSAARHHSLASTWGILPHDSPARASKSGRFGRISYACRSMSAVRFTYSMCDSDFYHCLVLFIRCAFGAVPRLQERSQQKKPERKERYVKVPVIRPKIRLYSRLHRESPGPSAICLEGGGSPVVGLDMFRVGLESDSPVAEDFCPQVSSSTLGGFCSFWKSAGRSRPLSRCRRGRPRSDRSRPRCCDWCDLARA